MFCVFGETLCSVTLHFGIGQCGLVMRWETFCSTSSNQDRDGVIKGCLSLMVAYFLDLSLQLAF